MDKKFYCLEFSEKKGGATLKAFMKDNFHDTFLNNTEVKNCIETEIVLGNKLFDYNSFSDGINCVISKPFRDLLVENNITGWKTYNVNIKGVKEEYFGFQITGKSGELVEPVARGFYTGYKFDYGTWDGSDFFSPEGTTLRFITEKVKGIIDNNKIANVDVKEITKIDAYSLGHKLK
jgi:hypothetical protein